VPGDFVAARLMKRSFADKRVPKYNLGTRVTRVKDYAFPKMTTRPKTPA